ncbi:DNA mismatch repair endonuclease MutL [Candidatus Methylacidithermus pantelleriae]|uniref:DNA mismatch repair protein MutL n=1 Tax=Candidatus Methylacidithermus pantelleriae TaxID=2744239 RepID=A0A8J2FML2_9BACT|nr:DNA mismatch repair endonuclease MutL [Candidatus Methylacidithermus pantelleriae]CAF0689175.1 DNA mismatch repair protein MutL [Candidatus Methylacidithermus pantelleriae]
MGDRIRILPDWVANQIAAGEVVERPASVLKELVENSLDAGASCIEVHTRSAGRWFVEVSDDGCGMSRNDALLCLERHATSKLARAEDLRRIVTYGFRGEALPSIAAVSRLTLRTREKEAPVGVEVETEAGKIRAVREAGRAAGTTVTVSSLFFNVPARRKFLRSPATERGHLQQILYQFALACPSVSFRWIQEGRKEIFWPACGSRQQRLEVLMGKEWVQELVPVQAREKACIIEGWVGRPTVVAQRAQEWFFVNGRPVVNRLLSWVVREVIRTHLMRGQYVPVFLWLQFPPEWVDVNVHPAKREIRLVEEKRIESLLNEALSCALRGSVRTATVGFPAGSPEGESPQDARLKEDPSGLRPQPGSAFSLSWDKGKAQKPVSSSDDGTLLETGERLRFRGRLGDLYLLVESRQGLLVIDQHAAHERVLFEKLLKESGSGQVPSQRLLLPVTVHLSPLEAALVGDHRALLARFGLEIHSLGGQSFLITAIPAWAKGAEPARLVSEVASALAEGGDGNPLETETLRHRVATIVCRQAIKSGDSLEQWEVERLIEDLWACQDPFHCPHGRPTMVEIGFGELEKRLGRTGPRGVAHS